jgi:hypothetical protein
MIRQSTDGAAVVNTELNWISLGDSQPGGGQRVLLINRPDGVARIDLYRAGCRATHWQALPTFNEAES